MSYEMVRLDEVSDIISGQSPPSSSYNDSGDGTPFFQGKADFNKLYPTVRYWCTEPKKLAKPNDILLSVRAPVGPTNICNIDATIGRGLAAIRSHSKLDYMFLLYYLRSFEHILANKGTGSTFSAITMKDVRAIPIPLPPLETQRKIIDILDKAQSLIDKRKEQIKEMDSLVQSLFYDMFGDPVTNPMGWEVKKLGDIGKVQTGNTPPRNDKANYGDYIEWIKTDNIVSDALLINKSSEMLSEKGMHLGRTVEKGSILVCCIAGSKKSIGRAGLTDRKVAFNQQINAITPNSSVNIKFIMYQFRIGQKLIQNASTNSMKGMVNKSAFSNVVFLTPPIELQNTFADRVKHIETQKEHMTSSLKELEDNFNCLMQKAFKGELI